MESYVAGPSPMGGVLWKHIDCAWDGYDDAYTLVYCTSVGFDDAYTLVKRFIKEYEHPEWSLSIFNSYTDSTMEIKCDLSEMPMIVEFVYHFEHAYPVLFIGENPVSESYVIGMYFHRGRIHTPSSWKADNGKLIMLN